MLTTKVVVSSLELWGGLFCLIAAICVYVSGVANKRKTILQYMELFGAILLFSDAFAVIFRGYPGVKGYWLVRISNFLVFFVSDLLTLLYHLYLMSYIMEKLKDRKYIVIKYVGTVICIIGMFLVIISQFTDLYYGIDKNNFYYRKPMHPLSLMVFLVIVVMDLYLLILYHREIDKKIILGLLSYTVLPSLSAMILLFYYGLSLVNISVCISLVMLFVGTMIEQGRIARDREIELERSRTKILLSQIQPHFLYNSLAVIQDMCHDKAPEVEETIIQFEEFLRSNLDSLTETNPITFTKEMNHTYNYVMLEMKRYGGLLKVVKDIQTEEFDLPPLTLQPIVENAIRYGVGPKENGGTVWISTFDNENSYVVKVKDDGMGYDITQKKEDGRTHVGILNVKERVERMCKGTLEIESKLGEGTLVVITIPKTDKNNSNYNKFMMEGKGNGIY